MNCHTDTYTDQRVITSDWTSVRTVRTSQSGVRTEDCSQDFSPEVQKKGQDFKTFSQWTVRTVQSGSVQSSVSKSGLDWTFLIQMQNIFCCRQNSWGKCSIERWHFQWSRKVFVSVLFYLRFHLALRQNSKNPAFKVQPDLCFLHHYIQICFHLQ